MDGRLWIEVKCRLTDDRSPEEEPGAERGEQDDDAGCDGEPPELEGGNDRAEFGDDDRDDESGDHDESDREELRSANAVAHPGGGEDATDCEEEEDAKEDDGE